MVLGCSGSGKSTLAAKISAAMDLPFIKTDPFYWAEDWTPVPASYVRDRLAHATAADRWVLDGNFDGDRDILWRRAELAVWLDLPWTVTVPRPEISAGGGQASPSGVRRG